ncbi:hypothetical protein AR457_34985 [Streptomyces agglomeratus]|uniref:DUF6286 domain-containing protein n=1 Tax=Streptomyces agglomeratus TaxID=285458 RepID=UPI0008525450|nr:DUF6286 domain-containing protein [Streptomyces agglomeratus]OEJ37195.1 hypothetical protein BGK70_02480 [Streptomyces agglomeratus]OEJ48549.1 hypothetical protein AR457_34985 [Streptomyces agglomeratus]OEJ57056.1 hypothetical protein BGM19_02585 [Streptomyces agglomeratus]
MSANTSRQPPGAGRLPSDTGQATPSADNAHVAGTRAAIDTSGRPPRRFWSARRIPAALAALLSAAAIGLLLYDVVSVRAGQSAMRWRRRLAEELSTRPLDDIWMIVGAALAMTLGLWLFILAVTPGRRRLLPMRQPTGTPGTQEVRAGLDRRAAALILRDRAMQVPGVQSAQVAVGHRKIKARAQAHFRDLEEVRTDLNHTLGEAVTGLGLTRPPTLSVHVRRPKKG